jgi:hypothetical protein
MSPPPDCVVDPGVELGLEPDGLLPEELDVAPAGSVAPVVVFGAEPALVAVVAVGSGTETVGG